MTTGTKIFLALFALIVGVLVVYYGMVSPGANPTANKTVAAGGANDDKTREPDASAGAHRSNASSDRRAAPPPRDPAPTVSPTTPLTTPPVAPPALRPGVTSSPTGDGTGGFLSEGVREATGEKNEGSSGGGVMQVQPGGDGRSPSTANPYLPLVGLNNGDLRSSPDESPKGDVEPVPSRPNPSSGASNGSNPGAASQPAMVDPKPLEPMPERNPAPAPPPKDSSAPSKPANAPSTPPARTEYLIAQGDTFVSIADAWFGDGNKWSLIARENPTVDPQKLKIGQRIFLPSKAAAISPAKPDPVVSAGETVYVIQSGDTLIAIARDHLGDGAKWEMIYDLNKATIGSDSAALKVGMKIKLPKKS